VSDEGIGIPATDQDRIFKIFERLHGQSAYPGTGIGLAVVKRAVERMNGRVWVESHPGQGSRFHVALPLSGSACPA
jgi:signal transduction histidine kinase